ncbi:hypothetical protein KCU93_g360, partial [Aureobasidium melanogenum]
MEQAWNHKNIGANDSNNSHESDTQGSSPPLLLPRLRSESIVKTKTTITAMPDTSPGPRERRLPNIVVPSDSVGCQPECADGIRCTSASQLNDQPNDQAYNDHQDSCYVEEIPDAQSGELSPKTNLYTSKAQLDHEESITRKPVVDLCLAALPSSITEVTQPQTHCQPLADTIACSNIEEGKGPSEHDIKSAGSDVESEASQSSEEEDDQLEEPSDFEMSDDEDWREVDNFKFGPRYRGTAIDDDHKELKPYEKVEEEPVEDDSDYEASDEDDWWMEDNAKYGSDEED